MDSSTAFTVRPVLARQGDELEPLVDAIVRESDAPDLTGWTRVCGVVSSLVFYRRQVPGTEPPSFEYVRRAPRARIAV